MGQLNFVPMIREWRGTPTWAVVYEDDPDFVIAPCDDKKQAIEFCNYLNVDHCPNEATVNRA